jgi:DNA polymerase-4
MSNQVNWLYLDLNSFFASCEQQENPYFRGKPLAVVPMLVDSTSVLAASYPAKKFGIKTGTKVFEAKRMCPDILFTLTRHKIYIQYHHKIIEAVEKCAPISSVQSIDEICIELTGSQKKLETAIQLAQKIKKQIKEDVGDCLTCSIGLATNKYLAKVATDMQKPDGLTSLLASDLPHKLYSLKLSDLPGVGKKMELHLNSQGIFTMEKLLSKSENELRYQIWKSVWGSRLYHWIRGVDLNLKSNDTQSISHQHVLGPENRNLDKAYQVTQRLLLKAMIRLRTDSFFTKRLGVYVKYFLKNNGSMYYENSQSFSETQDNFIVLKLLRKMWNEIPKEAKPLKVSVVLSNLVKQQHHQFSFFEDVKKNELHHLVDQINQKHGKDTVFHAEMYDVLVKDTAKIAFKRIPKLDEF